MTLLPKARGRTGVPPRGAPRYGGLWPTEWKTAALPGEDLILRGLRDLEAGVESVEALLVSIGAPRLGRYGIAVRGPFSEPEARLYALLAQEHGDAAHSRYNALVRRLVSDERAAAGV